MNEYANTPRALDWDDEISNETGSFLLLEEGDYNFTVTAFERSRFPGSAKIPPCNKATLTLEVAADGGTATVKYDLILFSTMQWKTAEFLRAIGQMKPEDTAVRPRWNEMAGAKGRARFITRTYTKKNGGEGKANDVERFYDYDPAFFQTSVSSWSNTGF